MPSNAVQKIHLKELVKIHDIGYEGRGLKKRFYVELLVAGQIHRMYRKDVLNFDMTLDTFAIKFDALQPAECCR